MKITLLISFLFFSGLNYGQGQFGITVGGNYSNYKTDDLTFDKSPINPSISVSFLSYLSKKSDLLFEVGYEFGKMDIVSYRDFNKNEILVNTKVKTEKLFFQALYNHYIIVPENEKIHLSLQGGIGTSIFDDWQMEESIFRNTKFVLKPYYIVGVSSGTEQLRVGLRYQNTITNPLDVYVNDIPDDNNNYDQRKYESSLSIISLSLTYFLEPFTH